MSTTLIRQVGSVVINRQRARMLPHFPTSESTPLVQVRPALDCGSKNHGSALTLAEVPRAAENKQQTDMTPLQERDIHKSENLCSSVKFSKYRGGS